MAGRTQLDLIRHGEPLLKGVYLGQTDCTLSESGRRLSEQALQYNPGWELVVSSPLQRCLESAQWLSCSQGIPLLVLDELKELDFGAWDGRTFEEVYQADRHAADLFWQNPAEHPPREGESLVAFSQRVDRVREQLLQRSEQRILVITHGGVIRCMLAQILGAAPAHWQRIKVDYSHFSQLLFEYAAGQWWPQLLSCNLSTLSPRPETPTS